MNAFTDYPDAVRKDLAGYSALIWKYALRVPLPARIAMTVSSKTPSEAIAGKEVLRIAPQRRPKDFLSGHLELALVWEGVDLAILSALFTAISREEITGIIGKKPTDKHLRRIWFLYEWLTHRELDLPDVNGLKPISVVDEWFQSGLSNGTLVTRQQVINNLPGTRDFCPLVRWTARNDQKRKAAFYAQVADIVGQRRMDIIVPERQESGYAQPWFSEERDRLALSQQVRWQEAVANAGAIELSRVTLEQLQRILIGDARLVELGLRKQHRFVHGHRSRDGRSFLTHICASPKDLPNLVDGMIAFAHLALKGGLDPVHAAASLAFGFAYIQPFNDGNRRLHRWLVQHVLTHGEPGLHEVVPGVSTQIVRQKNLHLSVLQSYSLQLLSLLRPRSKTEGSIKVTDETADFYRYFDATKHSEFLFDCIGKAAEDLPRQLYMQSYEYFAAAVQSVIDIPTHILDLLWRGLNHNFGRLPEKHRVTEFAGLTDAEVLEIENIFAEAHHRLQSRPSKMRKRDTFSYQQR